MKELLLIGQAYLAEILLCLMVAHLILSIISLHKTNSTRKMLKHIVQMVEQYMQAILEEENNSIEPKKEAKKPIETPKKSTKDMEQSQLIASVLKEIYG